MNAKVIGLALICLLGLFFRAEMFQHRDLNQDEDKHFNYALSAGFEPFWQRLHYGEELTSFPGHYLTTVPFIKAFHSKWGAAIPHIISTLLGFLFLYLICRRMFKTYWAILITFFFVAIHRELIYHAFELRPYAVLPTLALMSFYFLETLISPAFQPSFRQKAACLLLLLFTVAYHAYGILIVGVCSVFLLLRESVRYSTKAVYERTVPFYALLAVLAVPLWLWYNSGNVFRSGIDTFEFIADPAVHPAVFLKQVVGNLTGSKLNYIFLPGILFLPFCKPAVLREKIGYLLVLVIFPILLIFLSDVLSKYWFIQRQFIWVIPYFAIFIGWCWDSMLSNKVRA